MNYVYLEELIAKTQESLKYREKRLKEYQNKVDAYSAFSDVAEEHQEMKDLIKGATEWVTYLVGAIEADNNLLDILLTARDLKCECK